MALLLGSTWHKWHPCAGKATQTAFGSAPPLAHNVFLCGVQSLSRGSTPPTQPFIRLARRHATVWHVTEKRTIDSDCSRAIALLVLYVFCPPRCCDLPAIAPLVLSFARHGAAICPPSLFWCCLLPAPVLRFARYRFSGAVKRRVDSSCLRSPVVNYSQSMPAADSSDRVLDSFRGTSRESLQVQNVEDITVSHCDSLSSPRAMWHAHPLALQRTLPVGHADMHPRAMWHALLQWPASEPACWPRGHAPSPRAMWHAHPLALRWPASGPACWPPGRAPDPCPHGGQLESACDQRADGHDQFSLVTGSNMSHAWASYGHPLMATVSAKTALKGGALYGTESTTPSQLLPSPTSASLPGPRAPMAAPSLWRSPLPLRRWHPADADRAGCTVHMPRHA